MRPPVAAAAPIVVEIATMLVEDVQRRGTQIKPLSELPEYWQNVFLNEARAFIREVEDRP